MNKILCFAPRIVEEKDLVDEDEEWLIGKIHSDGLGRTLPLSALVDFVRLGGTGWDQAEFVRTYGVLQQEHLQIRRGMPRAARLAVEAGGFAAEVDQIDAERNRLRKLIEIDTTPSQDAKHHQVVREMMRPHLANTRLGTSWQEGRREPHLETQFVLDGLYSIFWAGLVGMHGEAVCPHCTRPFLKVHPRQVYCIERCSNNAKQKRFQARQRK